MVIGAVMTGKRQTRKQRAKTDTSRPPKAVKGKQVQTKAAETLVEKEPEAKKPKKSYDVEFYRDWCKGCGICAAFCPAGALSMNDRGEPEITEPELCTGCTWCEIRCPDFAIRVKETVEDACEA